MSPHMQRGDSRALSPRPTAHDHQHAPGGATFAQKAAQMSLQPLPLTALEHPRLRRRNPAAPIRPTSPHLPSLVGARQACLLAVVRRLGSRPHSPAPCPSGRACVDWKWALGWPRNPCAVKRRVLSQSVALMRGCTLTHARTHARTCARTDTHTHIHIEPVAAGR